MGNKKTINIKIFMYLLITVFILLLIRLFYPLFNSGIKSNHMDEASQNIQRGSSAKEAADFNSLFSSAMKMQNHYDYEDAIAQYKKAIAENPKNILADNAYYNIVEILNSPKMKRYSEAVELCRKILEQYPDSEVADNAQYYIAKTIHYTYKNPLDSIAEYKKFLEMFPESKHAKEAQNVLDYFNSDPDGDGFTEEQAIYREMMDEIIEEKPETQAPEQTEN